MKLYICDECLSKWLESDLKSHMDDDPKCDTELVEVYACPDCESEELREVNVETEIKCPECGARVCVKMIVDCEATAYFAKDKEAKVKRWDVTRINRRDYAEAFCTRDPDHELGLVRAAIEEEGLLE